MILGREYVGAEKRAYNAEEVSKRRQTERPWRGFGPRTILSNPIKDSNGAIISGQRNLLFKRLSKIQKSLISSVERNLWEAKPKLKMLTSKLNIPEFIKETAWRIYLEVVKKKLTMGRSIDGFLAASLYVAIRVHNFPIFFEEVKEVSITSRHTIHHSLGIIIKNVLPDLKLKYKPITAEQLIFRFGNELKIPIKTQRNAFKLLSLASTKGLKRLGKDPKGLAASVLFIAAKNDGYHKTQAVICKTARITEVTLRTRIKEIKEKSY